MQRPRLLLPLLLTLGLVLAACGGVDGDGEPGTAPPTGDGMATEMGNGMGGMGGMLGGSAETTSLAAETLDELPSGPLAWSAFAVSDVSHSHDPAFLHAREPTTVTIDGETRELAAGDSVFVAGGVEHRHGAGRAWDVLLADPQVGPPPGVNGDPEFRSEELEGLPEGEAELRTLLVELPPATETSVHEHPGPEFIYATAGLFVYESAPTGELTAEEGEHFTLAAGTAVQKRNPQGEGTAAFLSWFVVEPDQPFATEASFDD